jgi:hypothetical protein
MWAQMLLMAACLPLALSTLPGQPTHRSCLLGYGALVLSANNASADSSMQRIKQEATSRRLVCLLQNHHRHRPCRDAPYTARLSMLPRPVYPPTAGTGGEYSNAEALQREMDSLVPSPACTCQDVYDLQQKLSQVQHDYAALSRRLLRLETLPNALVQAFLASDDIALMERYACSAAVYNEQLTTKRPLRLIRDELKQLQGRYSP